MRKINIVQVVDDSKFNSFHLSILLWCIFLILFDGFDLVVYGSVIPSLSQSWSISPSILGLIGSLTLVGGLIGSLICGISADKVGRKKVIIYCVAIFGFFTLLTGFAKGPVDFAIYRFIAGLGLGGIPPLLVALTSEYSPKSIKNIMVAIMFSGYSIGGILVALLGLKVIPNLGWEWMFFIGAIPLLSIPLLNKYLPESLYYYVVKKEYTKAKAILKRLNSDYIFYDNDIFEVDVPKQGVPVVKLFENQRARTTIMFWISCFMGLLLVYGLGTWLPQMMVKLGYPLESSLLFLLSLNIGAIVGSIFGGMLADRIGSKRVLFGFFIMGAICLTLLGFKPELFVLYFLILLSGAASIGSQNLNNAYMSNFYPTSIRSTGIGWALGVGRLGAILGPSIGGILMDLNLPTYMNFISFAIPAIIAAIAICFIQDKFGSYQNIEQDYSDCELRGQIKKVK
ncbi:MFS transporter [Priestia megaterium]|uniref:MFS transporter n=1 Tax=Priestia megaterium TaxID=1404 RepID=UPI00203BC60C|nr:aromatic acid/H+ symport family MFS transporter [Priestia megaterium]MCM3186398.1 aromatic acid/H+ symport family MFS transporter [Priestia megaterium]